MIHSLDCNSVLLTIYQISFDIRSEWNLKDTSDYKIKGQYDLAGFMINTIQCNNRWVEIIIVGPFSHHSVLEKICFEKVVSKVFFTIHPVCPIIPICDKICSLNFLHFNPVTVIDTSTI